MNSNVPQTPPPSPAKSKDMERMQNNHSYAFAHWCDKDKRWIVSPHHFLVNVTANNIIGQFITSDWFSCYIYPQKTFLVVKVKKGVSTKQLEESLNSPNATDPSMIKNIETFITGEIEQYTSRIDWNQCEKHTFIGVKRNTSLSNHPLLLLHPSILLF